MDGVIETSAVHCQKAKNKMVCAILENILEMHHTCVGEINKSEVERTSANLTTAYHVTERSPQDVYIRGAFGYGAVYVVPVAPACKGCDFATTPRNVHKWPPVQQ